LLYLKSLNYKSKFAQHLLEKQHSTDKMVNIMNVLHIKGKRPDDEHNREILHIPGNKNEQPNKQQTDSPTKHLIRNYSPIRNPQRAPNCTRPPSQPPIPTLSNSTQSERKQTSVICYTKRYNRTTTRAIPETTEQ